MGQQLGRAGGAVARVGWSLAVAAAAVIAVGCTAIGPGSPAGGGPSVDPTAPGSGRTALVVDTDLGADDIVALAMVAADPTMDLRAVTIAGTGLVHCSYGVPRAASLLARLGMPDVPVACGREQAAPPAVPFPDEWRAGTDAAYGLPFTPASLQLDREAVAVLRGAAAELAPRSLTILELGPWTNLADAIAADPAFAARIEAIHAMGGTIDHEGNVFRDGTIWSAKVEANLAADPAAVAAVLKTTIPIRLVPLDATDSVPVPADLPTRLLDDRTTAAADLAFELFARNPFLASDGQFLWDETAAAALLQPSVADWSNRELEVSLRAMEPGRITVVPGGRTVSVATGVDGPAVTAAILRQLRTGVHAARPIRVHGPVVISATNASCTVTGIAGTTGLTWFRLVNQSAGQASAVVVWAVPPKTVADLRALAAAYEPDSGALPAWVRLVIDLNAPASGTSEGFSTAPDAHLLPVCGIGEPWTLIPGPEIVPER